MACGLVRIRLARFGRVNSPVYNIVVARSHKARDAKPIEVLGTYNPVPRPLKRNEVKKGVFPTKEVALDFDRAKYWIGVGAQPSDTVIRLFQKAGILGPEWGSKKNTIFENPVVQPKRELNE
ncbi:Small ribosomal subunit protein bS16m [Nakaseomyces bracarensis]|uniref:Small ribosomal subunit protein bS16m n=1 Tax=Nakaseomyces bracarensis TaxID=273131 RepID=A0ABR4NY55_9SACH